MIKGSLALMLSHGQRPRKQLGHHIAIIEFAQKNLSGCRAGIGSDVMKPIAAPIVGGMITSTITSSSLCLSSSS